MRVWAIPEVIEEERRSLLEQYSISYSEKESNEEDTGSNELFEYCYMHGSDLYREYEAYAYTIGDESQLKDRFGRVLRSSFGWWIQDYEIERDGKVYKKINRLPVRAGIPREMWERIQKDRIKQYCYPNGVPMQFVRISDELREIIEKALREAGESVSSDTGFWRHKLYTDDNPVEFPQLSDIQRTILEILYRAPHNSIDKEDLCCRLIEQRSCEEKHPIRGIVDTAVESMNKLDEYRELIEMGSKALIMTPRGWQEYVEMERFPYIPTYYHSWRYPNDREPIYSPEFLEFVEREGKIHEERIRFNR